MVRHSVLSAVSEQRRKLLSAVSASDRARLDEYFSSVRDLERKLAFELDRPAPLPACTVPEEGTEEIGSLVEQVERTHRQFAQLLAHAMACGQTRIFNLTMGSAFSRLRRPGEVNAYHALTHEEPIDRELGYQPTCKWLGERMMDFFRELVQTLDGIREGDGTLLDRTVVFAFTDHGEARMHSMKRYPILTAGSGGGRMKTGLHVAAEGDGGDPRRVHHPARARGGERPVGYRVEPGVAAVRRGAGMTCRASLSSHFATTGAPALSAGTRLSAMGSWRRC